MAVRNYCNQEMLSADGCTDAAIIIRRHAYAPIRVRVEHRADVYRHH
jgi:hypothetical protein